LGDRIYLAVRPAGGDVVELDPGPFTRDDGAIYVSAGGAPVRMGGVEAGISAGPFPEGAGVKVTPLGGEALPAALPAGLGMSGGLGLLLEGLGGRAVQPVAALELRDPAAQASLRRDQSAPFELLLPPPTISGDAGRTFTFRATGIDA